MAHIELLVTADLIDSLTWDEDSDAEPFHGGKASPEAQARLNYAIRILRESGHTVYCMYGRINVTGSSRRHIVCDADGIEALIHDEILKALDTAAGIQEPDLDPLGLLIR